MKYLLAAAALLGCGNSDRHRESISDPPPVPAPVPADASPWHDDTIDWPAGPRDDAAAIGTEHPIRWAHIDEKRRWVLLCDQREDTNGNGTVGDTRVDGIDEYGDAPAMHLVLGSGPGRAVDAVLAISPTGDHLAIATDRAVALLDVEKHVAHRLPGARPVAVFSGDGKRLVYVTEHDIVRRELATGAETRVPLPAGEPALANLDTPGRWLVLALARGNDKGMTWLTADWGLRPVCALGMVHFGVDLRRPTDKVWIDLDHGTVRDDQTIVRIVGDHVLARPSIGELDVDGKRVSPRDCEKVATLAVHESPFAMLIGCTPKEGKSRVELLGPKHTSFPALLFTNAIEQLAPMADERESCGVPDKWCVDMLTGARREDDFKEPTVEGSVTYAHTATHVLIGAEKQGPLHWHVRDKAQ